VLQGPHPPTITLGVCKALYMTAMMLLRCFGRPDPCYDRLSAQALTCRPVEAAHPNTARQPGGQ